MGLATNLSGRLKQHLRDRHHGAWDKFSVYLTSDDGHMKELESLVIRIAAPKGNRQKGKFVKSKEIQRTFIQRMRNADADKRSLLLGGQVSRRKGTSRKGASKKGASKKGAVALAGLVERRRRIRAEYKGWIYSATLRKDGRISYDGDVFDSPTAAAKSIVKRRANGWQFWKYRDPKKGWLPIARLRR